MIQTILYNELLVAVVAMPLMLLAMCIDYHLRHGWELRHHEISSSFHDRALLRYFGVFFGTDLSAGPLTSVPVLRTKFEDLFSQAFGRDRFRPPALLLLAVTGLMLAVIAPTTAGYLLQFAGVPAHPAKGATVAMAGLAALGGGYFWVVQFLVRRIQQRLLTPWDLYYTCARIVLCLPIGLALTAFAKDDVAAPVAFMLGAFPTETLVKFMRRTAASKLDMQDSFSDPGESLSKLQGVDRDQAEGFAGAGVGNINQLAYADPVDLTIRTGYSFSYVVDCCSQALAWIYFEDKLSLMRPYGLRGAQEISTFLRELDGETGPERRKTGKKGEDTDDPHGRDDATIEYDRDMAEKTLEELAPKIGLGCEALVRVLWEVSEDPYTLFLCDVWQTDWY